MHKTPKPRPPKPTLADVARLAGVSLGSASRAMSAPDQVRSSTRERVSAAALQLGYVVDGIARALASRRSGVIGVVVPTVNNPIYADFIHWLQKSLSQLRYQLIVTAHEYNADTQTDLVRSLLERGIDGLLLVGTEHPREVTKLLSRTRIPHLFCWSTDRPTTTHCIGFSDREASYRMTRYLAGLGHRSFAVIAGEPNGNERARERIQGVRDALAVDGLALAPKRVVVQPFSIQGGRDGLRSAWNLRPRPTALICGTDLLAAGALAQATEVGIAVPNQMSIVGFDDIELASLMKPSITTIHVPAGEIGRLSAKLIVQAIESIAIDRITLVETQLIIRESSAAPRTRTGNV